MERLREEIMINILPYLDNLQWGYILSFVLLCYGWQELEKVLTWQWIDKIKKRFKVAIIGIAYAPIHYFLWGLERDQIGLLFSSFLVSFAFHKLLIEIIIKQLKNFILSLDLKQKGANNG